MAIFGFSHGGGSTHDLADRLDDNRATIGVFTIPYTAYIDAINNNANFDPTTEGDRPPSVWHLNIYETIDGAVHGGHVAGSDREINVTTDGDTAGSGINWDSTDDHQKIDDDPLVRDAVKDELRRRVGK